MFQFDALKPTHFTDRIRKWHLVYHFKSRVLTTTIAHNHKRINPSYALYNSHILYIWILNKFTKDISKPTPFSLAAISSMARTSWCHRWRNYLLPAQFHFATFLCAHLHRWCGSARSADGPLCKTLSEHIGHHETCMTGAEQTGLDGVYAVRHYSLMITPKMHEQKS